jgi:hypothetical protein
MGAGWGREVAKEGGGGWAAGRRLGWPCTFCWEAGASLGEPASPAAGERSLPAAFTALLFCWRLAAGAAEDMQHVPRNCPASQCTLQAPQPEAHLGLRNPFITSSRMLCP